MVSTGGIDHSAHQCGVVGVDPIAPMCTDWSPLSAVTAIEAASTHAITRNARTRERFTSRSWHQTQAPDDQGLQQTDALGQMTAARSGWPAAPAATGPDGGYPAEEQALEIVGALEGCLVSVIDTVPWVPLACTTWAWTVVPTDCDWRYPWRSLIVAIGVPPIAVITSPPTGMQVP